MSNDSNPIPTTPDYNDLPLRDDKIHVFSDKVITGKADWRTYRAIRLENGVTCMLVNDKESKTTAMAACVHAGASADPRNLSGLAHFCEHMCFLGSEKYPGENDYKRYLSCHGGRSNASTSMHVTTYKFDVLAEHAETAVDMFSNFFVSPLFTPSGTSREVQAVDSEDSKNKTADSRRRLQILKALADPEHYYSKFTTGNLKTLPAKDDDSKTDWIREALLTFHRRHYRPDNMTVVIVGPQSLDTLQEWIVPRFASMKTKDFPSNPDEMTDVERLIEDAANDAPPFVHGQPEPPHNPAFRPNLQEGAWPILLTSRPVRSMRKLVINFPLPPVQKVPDQSPTRLLSHLLGHEGPGSSFALLQNKGLISSLSAGPRVSGPDQCLFQVGVALTAEGEERWKEVVDILFAHCRLIYDTAANAQSGDKAARQELERIWGEIADLGRIHFDQTSPGQAYQFAPSVAQSIAMHGTANCISVGNMLNEAPETLPLDKIVDMGSRLVPENCIVERCSQMAWDEMNGKAEETKNDKTPFGKNTEQWYGVDYYLYPIDSATTQEWKATELEQNGSTLNSQEKLSKIDHKSLHLPRPNRYIPRSLELCPELPPEATAGSRIDKEIDPPNLIINEKGLGRLWHRLDDRYALPKSSLTFLVRNAAVQHVRDDSSGRWDYDVNSSIKSAMVTGIFSEALAQETYDADLAGLYWSLSASSSGIQISCSGYSDRLPDLALKLLEEFYLVEKNDEKGHDGVESFFKQSYFDSVKDRLMRNFRTYFQSRRADAHAMYYRDMLLSSRDEGLDVSLDVTESTTLESLKEHHRMLLENDESEIECLFSGNVSREQAEKFFSKAASIHRSATNKSPTDPSGEGVSNVWTPGTLERRLVPGKDIDIHFASQNPDEENGAVLVTYQSRIPGFKGDKISSPESLKRSASMRLLCHMLREPLFDELRTKQQLGYVVSSYYDIGFSSRQDMDDDTSANSDATATGPWTTPVEFIVVNVLSKAQDPVSVALRIDEFMQTFKEMLENMPESEIRHHADALSQKLTKPIQKLGSEASMHFGKIRRYGPEILADGGRDVDLPWESTKSLASAIKSLERVDLMDVWNRVVADNCERSRVVSCVYGKKFPLSETFKGLASVSKMDKGSVVNNFDELLNLRTQLKQYSSRVPELKKHARVVPEFFSKLKFSKTAWGVAGAALIGAGIVGLGVSRRQHKQSGAS